MGLRLVKAIGGLVIVWLLGTGLVYGQNQAEQYQNIQNQINELTEKIKDSQNQQKTLASTISLLNNQIALKELEIRSTEVELETVEREIVALDINLDEVAKILVEKISESYRRSFFNPSYYIFTSGGFGEFLERAKYLQEAQKNDRKILEELQGNKDEKEIKQNKLTALEAQLKTQNQQLATQKNSKQELLQATKNDEQGFQQLIAKLKADAESIARALAGTGVKLGDVNKGDRIAGVGSSGCSTGPHLHMEVLKPAHVEKIGDSFVIVGWNNKVDPLPFIKSGQYPKPTASYSGNDCSQGGGCKLGDITTTFLQWYEILGGSYHTGLDVADYSGAAIFAAAKGTSYMFSDSKACSLTGTVGKGVVLDHENEDVVTLYWHIP